MQKKTRILSFLFFCSFLFTLSILHAAPTFFRESTTKRLDEGSPSVVTTLPSGTIAIFYTDNYHVYIATSSDGTTFAEKAYVAISTSTKTIPASALDDTYITSCAITQLPSLEYKMIYAAQSSTGVYSLLTATSTNMASWGKSSTASPIMIGNGGTYIGSPFILQTTGYWYLYYTRDKNSGNNTDDYVIAYATSTDNGITWGQVPTYAISDKSKDPQVIKLSDNTYRMYYVGETSGGDAFGSIRSATSDDLVTFDTENTVVINRSSSDDTLSHPRAIKLANGYAYRMYYGYMLSSKTTAYTLTAMTTAPYLISITPTSGINTGTVDVTIKGEIFDTSPSITLTYTDQPDITGTGITRINDTTITGTFDLTSKLTKTWDLVVTNANGESDTLASAFTIEGPPIPEGFVEVSENVFNPNTAQRAAINFTLYVNGKMTITIYTIIGELVKTLIDQDYDTGSYTETWDGKNMKGDIVASGIYLVHIQGPGIEKIKKIAVVK